MSSVKVKNATNVARSVVCNSSFCCSHIAHTDCHSMQTLRAIALRVVDTVEEAMAEAMEEATEEAVGLVARPVTPAVATAT